MRSPVTCSAALSCTEDLLTVLQLSDSGFPIGGFSHSNGYEAALQLGYIKGADSLSSFCEQTLENTASLQLPFVRDSFKNTNAFLSSPCTCTSSLAVETDSCLYLTTVDQYQIPQDVISCQCHKYHQAHDLLRLDCLLDANMSNHVSRRASVRQGSGMLVTAMEVFSPKSTLENGIKLALHVTLHESCTRCFNNNVFAILKFLLTAQDNDEFNAHFAIVFGCICAIRRISCDSATKIFMFGALRSVLSAAVRQGLVGPYEGQRLQCDGQLMVPILMEKHKSVPVEDAYIGFPLIDIMQSSHNHFFSKMFYS